jgi:GrpB-like predicted nucleotidyltransferase (UPF0157 family)
LFTFVVNCSFGDWGFLQFPHYVAETSDLMECNLHIFPTGSPRAKEKLLMVNFLKSKDGELLRGKYSDTKIELERRVQAGELEASAYSSEKGAIITEIFAAASKWDSSKM